jgi:hypothetical protein
MHIHVDTAADPKGGLAPRSLRFDGRNVGISDVVDNWAGAGDRYFRVKDGLDNTYILRHDESHGTWELLMFLSKRGAAFPDLLAKAKPSRAAHGDGKV